MSGAVNSAAANGCATSEFNRRLRHGHPRTSSQPSRFLPKLSRSMPDEFTWGISLLVGVLVVVSLFVSPYLRGDPMVRPIPLIHAIPEQCLHVPQLDAIPTVGFSDPILSYFSAFQFIFDSFRMLKEGYQKVICLSLYAMFLASIR